MAEFGVLERGINFERSRSLLYMATK